MIRTSVPCVAKLMALALEDIALPQMLFDFLVELIKLSDRLGR